MSRQLNLFEEKCCSNCFNGAQRGKEFHCYRRCNNGTKSVKPENCCDYWLPKDVDFVGGFTVPCFWEGLPCPYANICPKLPVECVVIKNINDVSVIGEMEFCDEYGRKTFFKVYGSVEQPLLSCRDVWKSSSLNIDEYKWDDKNMAFFTERGVYYVCHSVCMQKGLKKVWHDWIEKLRAE